MQSVNPNITDVTAPMLKIRAANPDVLLLTTYARPAALIIKKAQELGWNKPIVLAVNGTADLKQLVENVGNKDAFKNVYIQDVLSDLPGGPKLTWVYDMYKQAYPDLAAKPGHPQTTCPTASRRRWRWSTRSRPPARSPPARRCWPRWKP